MAVGGRDVHWYFRTLGRLVPSLTVERARDYTRARRGPLRTPAVQLRIARSAPPVDDGPSRCGARRAAIIRYFVRPAS